MKEPPKVWTTREILQFHEDLELKFGDGDGGDFLFGWQSVNPFASDLLAAVRRRSESIDYTKYSYMEADQKLADSVKTLHKQLDGISPESVLCAASGGTSIDLTDILNQRDRDYCIGMISSRW